ncbi:MAG TPA: carboxypeptidase regulatory-like domain-containing protein [Gemmatimonadales bacterium]|nr:carboxypeptidase regulatory-like domain-containing protein [Gemmatimonadales bacterium]
MIRSVRCTLPLIALLIGGAALGAQAPTAQGRVSGQVVEQATGRPMPEVQVEVIGTGITAKTDLDGRYRTVPLPAGRYSVRAIIIGFRSTQHDSVLVEDGRSTDVSFALQPLPIELAGVTVEAQRAPPSKATDAGLLAARRAAAGVSDGVSAQGIARSPDANAGEAVRRMTGVTLFDGKFLVVRGLGERYSNALLNGAEMPNPVVEKKIPPLDLFPAGLIASVVAAKTATPDKPGDFAGGSVDLVTKDFPESRLLQFTASQSYNDQATFRSVPLPPMVGTDFLGIDNGRRQPPSIPFGNLPASAQKPVLQGFQDNVWNPPPRRALPGTGFSATYGDQWQGTSNALGAVLSLTYNNSVSFTPDRLFNLYYVGREATASVAWGGLANVIVRLGHLHKLGWKNLYSRSADQTSVSGEGSEGTVLNLSYQMRYVERYLWQTQLTGEHHVFGTTLEWKGTLGRARIEDPDNHAANYATALEVGGGTQVGGKRLIRRLADLTRSGQVDWSVPVSLRFQGDALFKAGGYYRAKRRDYDARDVIINRDGLTAPASGMDGVIEHLPPEQVFAPENLGTYFSYISSANHNDPFFADDNVAAAYAMVDVPVLPMVRLVTGVRAEQWKLALRPGGNDPEGNWLKFGEDSVIRRHDLDYLWSGNLTIGVTENMKVRLAATRTLARPDSREISPGQYTPIAGLGNCTEQGNPDLQATRITNGDIRWELYPRQDELLAVSGFYKRFDQPIIELRTTGGFQNANAECTIGNGRSAEVRGGELEVRQLLGPLGVGLNLTVVSSSIVFPENTGLLARRFIGQSPFVANAYLAYEPAASRIQFSLLYNYFGDRITKYSNNQTANAPPYPNPNWVERHRHTVDAKVRVAVTPRFRLALSGKNLSRAPIFIIEDSGSRRVVEHYNLGLSFSTSLTYDF